MRDLIAQAQSTSRPKKRWSMIALSVLLGISGSTLAATSELKIGFQKYGTLPILKARGTLEKALKPQGVSVRWVEFPAGPQLLEGLNVGSIQLGETGEAPPIFAQAAQAPLVYIANQPAASTAEALIVPKNSPYKTIAELKGKRIALNKGSNVHYLLLKLLEKNGLKLADIQAIYLPPADARAAFEKGAVDAWVIWDPFLAAAEKQLGARTIANGSNLVSNYQFYLADRTFATQNPKIVQTVINELNSTSQWAQRNRNEAAKVLQQQTGLALPIVSLSVNRMGFGIKPVNATVIAAQQKVADAFSNQGLIPKPIKVSAATINLK
jgi:sulfonate transport system substrate-binding protein